MKQNNVSDLLCMSLQLTEDDMRSLLFGDYMKPDVVGTIVLINVIAAYKVIALLTGTKTL